MKSVFEIGKKYGRLTIKEYAGKSKNGSTLVKCVCDCGVEKIVRLCSLKKGQIKSCGCLAKELLIKRNKTVKYTTHGQSRTRLYSIWCDMKQRCFNKNQEVFKHYGQRNIEFFKYDKYQVCKEKGCFSDDCWICPNNAIVTRPPQSWAYCELGV